MEDQLISFETAKLAIEKGFNISVLNCYNENEELGDFEDYSIVDFNSFPIVKGSNMNMYSAPTQTLLQRWLREKHDIHISPIPLSRDNNIIVFNYGIFSDKVHYNAATQSWFATHLMSQIESGSYGIDYVPIDNTLTTGTTPPTTTNPADPNAGDVYIDKSTGDRYTYSSTTNT